MSELQGLGVTAPAESQGDRLMASQIQVRLGDPLHLFL